MSSAMASHARVCPDLYSADQDRADGKAFINRADGDRHQFRFIVSAEDGCEYDDLKPLTRR
jgi:type IV secretory pathway VirD2 relaxase